MSIDKNAIFVFLLIFHNKIFKRLLKKQTMN